MKVVGVQEAKAQLLSLLRRVRAGEEIVITRRGTPVARLVRFEPGRRKLGMDEGTFVVPDDFDAPLDEDVLATFES